MKRTGLALALIMALLVISGCGSDVTVSSTFTVPGVFPPEITALQFTQDTNQRVISGSFQFSAPDSDLDTMTIVVDDAHGREVSRTITDLRSFRGYSGGTLYFSIDYVSYLPDQYAFTIYVTDRAGYPSNGLYGTFWAL